MEADKSLHLLEAQGYDEISGKGPLEAALGCPERQRLRSFGHTGAAVNLVGVVRDGDKAAISYQIV